MWVSDTWERWALVVILGLALATIATFGARRLYTTLLTLRTRAWTPALSRPLSHWVKTQSYSDEAFFRADGASEPWIERRRGGDGAAGRIVPGRVPAVPGVGRCHP